MILVILLYLFSFLLIWQFLGYPIFMAFIALKPQRNYKDYTFQPYVSILVPTYNEKNMIRNRIENLISMNYPGDKYEIIVVDSGSGDGTAEIVDSFMKEYHDTDPALRLIREERRKGKASAINTGKNHSKGDIVLVTDANCIFDKNVLREMMPHFKDPSVGAVGGRYIVANPIRCDNIYPAYVPVRSFVHNSLK
jgi:cellulose synthase/poly-beta-1,6-N-acetylglucosamine synthase-like glycosyltransferase